jgi:4-amino-4-deoxy-L-arabinose transferase-like glycosyltransferase
MLRVLLEPALLFALPFAVYILYMSVRQRYPFTVEAWSHSRVATLALAGLAVAVLGVIVLGVFAPREQGAYVPAHVENGRLVPGRFE